MMAEQQQDKGSVLTPGSVVTSDVSSASEDSSTLTSDFGHMRLQKNMSSYVESDHWSAILDEINDLKHMVNEKAERYHDLAEEEMQTLPGADLFFLQTYPTTKLDIISALPPRPVVDSMIAKYFKAADMPITLIIHRRVFFKQYERFWQDPLGTPTIWITILFGMMFIVSYGTLKGSVGHTPVDEGTLLEYQTIALTARERMIQCLRLGNYMKGTPHTIEALLTLLQTEHLTAKGDEAQQGCWQLVGTIIRVALKMGYHRDGSHFPEISPFEAEMRRRIWYMLIQMDIASASQVGLPRAIKEAQCDTAEPRSLFDDDFDDTTTVLPPARPFNEHTLSQFLIYKSRIVKVYGMICDFTTSSKQYDHDEAMRLDRLLLKAYTQKPPVLELKPIHRSIMDGTELITRRLYIAMSFHHSRMTLHRKFMILAKTKTEYTISYTACTDAAFAALDLQMDLSEHIQPGRMLYGERWKMMALMQSEFLLATIILCYNLDDDIKNARLGKSSLSTHESMRKVVGVLQSARESWRMQQDVSKEAQTGVKAIDIVLAKVRDSGMEFVLFDPSFTIFPAAKAPNITTSSPEKGTTATFPPTATSAGSSHSYSSSEVIQSSQQGPTIDDTAFMQQAGLNEGSWNEFFDLDESWDTWMQL